jgi:thioredoxin reductase/ferredoxin
VNLWLLYVLPLLLVVAVYTYRRKQARANHVSTYASAKAQGRIEPPSLHPVIDPLACIGSGSCVKACPEQALGLIDGRAELVDPAACIGHGACLASCSFDAIKLVFGTARRGIDIPNVAPNFESNVPGIFIAGELGGMGLIRKATEQGRQAIESVAVSLRSTARRVKEFDWDVVIVGAGPAGIAAALTAKSMGLRYVVLEQEEALGGTVFHYPRRKVVMTSPVSLPLVGKLKFGEVSKEVLLQTWQSIQDKENLRLEFSQPMSRLTKVTDGFVVHSPNRNYSAARVLLAIGRRGSPRKLGVEGEEQSKVVYRLTEPEQYAGRHVLVVGGGDSAVEAALAVADAGAFAGLSYRGDSISRAKPKNLEALDRAARGGHLRLMLQSQIDLIDASHVELSGPSGRKSIENDDVIVCAGGVLPKDLLESVGIEFSTKRGEA